MALFTLVSASGAPGVTTTALALAGGWPRPVTLVEADPRGGSSILAGFFKGTVDQPGLLQPRSADAHSWVMVSAFRKWPRSRFRVWVWSVRRCARLFHCGFLVVPVLGGWSARGEGGWAERCGVERVELVLPGPAGG